MVVEEEVEVVLALEHAVHAEDVFASIKSPVNPDFAFESFYAFVAALDHFIFAERFDSVFFLGFGGINLCREVDKSECTLA